MRTYKVEATRNSKWWFLEVPEVDGCYTQARTLRAANDMAREAIATVLDVALDSFDIALVVKPWNEDLSALREMQEEIDQMKVKYHNRRTAILRAMQVDMISVRDAAEIFGMSHQRVAQLLTAEPKQI